MMASNNNMEARIVSLEAWRERALPVFDKLRKAIEEIEVLHVEVATLKKVIVHAISIKS